MAKNSSESMEALAAEIGENVYIDIAKWHLYLRDAHLHTVLAEKFYPLMGGSRIKEDEVVGILQEITVQLGGGKRELPLSDLVPVKSVKQLVEVLEEYQRKNW